MGHSQAASGLVGLKKLFSPTSPGVWALTGPLSDMLVICYSDLSKGGGGT